MGEDRGSLEDLLRKVLNDPPVFAAAHYDPKNGRVPPHLAVICMRGLEKNPERRFQSAQELERALQHWIEGEGAVMCAVTFQLSLLNRYKRALVRHPRVFQFVPILLSLALLTGLGFALFRAFGAH